ncbi:MAG TPA: tetratricopeptide repeat protein [Terriglobales bacterium]|nr:tetratricopeptide repeat protein [Terriglobales bacterium]
MCFRSGLILVLSLSLFCLLSRAQEQHEHAHFGDLGQVGTVHFPTSCSPAVQAQFERSVAMLHSFWYEEASKAFQSIAETDPSCSMAWWGVAMSLWHPLWPAPDAESLQKGQTAVAKAQSPPAKSDRERDYIAAIAVFYKDYDKVDHRTRSLAYEKAMQQLAQRYANDREASIFYALALVATALPTDKTYTNQRKAGEILEKVFVEQPNHPGAAHYIIHSYDNPVLAERALPAARAYAKIAPNVPHAQHMPSHIFVRLGLWQEAIASNLASASAARDYEIRSHMDGVWDQRLHAMDYLVYSYLQTGQEDESRRVVEETSAITDVKPAGLVAGYALAAIPARFSIERQRWAGAACLTSRPNIGPAAGAITWWGRALGASRLGDLAAAQADLEQIQLLKNMLDASSNPDAQYWAGQAEIQRREAAAWLAHAQGRHDEALKLMRSAAEMEDAMEKNPITPGSVVPARELLADLLMETQQPTLALTEYQTSLKSAPRRFHAVYGAAQAAESANQPELAKSYYTQLVELCSQCRPEDPSLRHAQQFLSMELSRKSQPSK